MVNYWGTKNAHVTADASIVAWVRSELVLRVGRLLLGTTVVQVDPVHEILSCALECIRRGTDTTFAFNSVSLGIVRLYLLSPVV